MAFAGTVDGGRHTSTRLELFVSVQKYLLEAKARKVNTTNTGNIMFRSHDKVSVFTHSRPEGSFTTPSSFSLAAKKANPSALVPAEARQVNTDKKSTSKTDRNILMK